MDNRQTTRASHGRRQFLSTMAGGFGMVALTDLLSRDGITASAQAADAGAPLPQRHPLAVRPPHFAPRAQRVIHIFCPGGMSHVDTFDYKPELERRAGKPFDPTGDLQFFASKPGNCQPSFWKFRQRGQSGLWVSDLLPKLAACVDDMAFIHSMKSKTALHGPACFMMNTGFIFPGFPSMGAWVTYGLGSASENLPAFVVLPDPRGLPPGGPLNWGAGFLPAVHQGTAFTTDAKRDPVADLFPAEGFETGSREEEASARAFLQQLNRRHADKRTGESELEARIAAMELAAKLQLSVPSVTDLAGESKATLDLYQLEHEDLGPFARQCLLARRLVERGVRFVQLFCGAENTTAKKIRPNWDSHEDLPRDHGYWGPVLDHGAAALLSDLKARGMLDDTLVICSTEFGRQPGAQGGKGRDHNAGAYTTWLAGGGIKGGVSYGETDDLGFQSVKDIAYSYDLHATCLHLMGIDHTKLSYYHNGINRRLTDVHGHVIQPLLA
ncbi:MAG: DUF1501 domain-containing protein [Phycisphaeraceae bacterium]